MIVVLASVDFLSLGSHTAFRLFLALAVENTLQFTPDLNPCHYQVHTLLIFTNVQDKDVICLNTKNQESMHLGMENIGNF